MGKTDKKKPRKSRARRKPWRRWRHKPVRDILALTLGIYTKVKYNIKVEKHRDKRPCLILYNHQTAFDQFFVGMAFSQPVYYVATEDIFTKGWVSSLIKFLVAPIPIKKQSSDVSAVMTSIRVAREGGTIAIAPEGNRTFSGRTGYMNPAIATLARKLGMPVCIFRIEGGYGVHPRWSDTVRRGSMRAYVSEVIEPDRLTDMTDAELADYISCALYVDESGVGGSFISKRRAEYIERAMYVCPYCGISELHSEGDTVTCTRCGESLKIDTDMGIRGVNKPSPVKSIGEWYDCQLATVNGMDISEGYSQPHHSYKVKKLFRVVPYKRKYLLSRGESLCLYYDRITVGERVMPFDEVSVVTVLGRNKLNIYHGEVIYQIKCDKRFNALRYMNMYYRYKNVKEGKKNEQFLGL